MNKVPNFTNVLIKDWNAWCETKGLSVEKGKELAKGLLGSSAWYNYSVPDTLIGNHDGDGGTWTGNDRRWLPPIPPEELIWLAAPDWADELYLGRVGGFWWAGGDMCQKFGLEATTIYKLRESGKLISTRPAKQKQTAEFNKETLNCRCHTTETKWAPKVGDVAQTSLGKVTIIKIKNHQVVVVRYDGEIDLLSKYQITQIKSDREVLMDILSDDSYHTEQLADQILAAGFKREQTK